MDRVARAFATDDSGYAGVKICFLCVEIFAWGKFGGFGRSTRVIGRAPVARVFAEGGATAAELVREMGWPRLTVMRELAPGVATLATGRDDAILLTIKPGSYAWPARWT